MVTESIVSILVVYYFWYFVTLDIFDFNSGKQKILNLLPLRILFLL